MLKASTKEGKRYFQILVAFQLIKQKIESVSQVTKVNLLVKIKLALRKTVYGKEFLG